MTKKMLIDASHPEETRVVIVDGNRVEELDFESRHKRQLRGNVYLARVTRVEPSLQAAFIEYGGNRHGFLAFSEIHPDYYQIPHEDKMALLEAEEAENQADDEQDDDENGDDDEAQERDENVDPDTEDAADADDEEVADEQAKVASTRRKRMSRRRYKIQEVIKRGQILLIQAVKEERGNKGAAMTSYLSLAGRYCVLMPNTARGGGISRKIANGSDRKRLKSVMSELEVPQGMGVIVRTAGAKRTKPEIKRDYEYLSRLWDEIRDTTLNSIAPALIHEEGNLVKRSIRDLYNKDIEEVLIQGEEAHKTAKAFMKMLMPSHAKNVKLYKDDIPLYLRYNVERQIEDSLKSVVQLKSGGYLVIHPTEALVSVDVNSGRSTKERNVERTALKTNTEAAEEVARQMRLRDLAGLIVIDFIDMDENRNNRAVENKMKQALSRDRARVQTSRISQFGLMEISRQRRRRSLLEGSTAHCEHCEGVGRKRTVESSALAAIRAVEDFGVRGKANRIRLKVSSDVALYLFNEKRELLQHVDKTSGLFTELVGDESLIRPAYEIEVIEKSKNPGPDPLEEIEKEFRKARQKSQKAKEKERRNKKKSDEDDAEEIEGEENTQNRHSDDEDKPKRRRRRRGRRGGRGKRREEHAESTDDSAAEDSDAVEASDSDETEQKPKRGRGRRKAPPKKAKAKEDSAKDDASDAAEQVEDKPKRKRATRKAPSRKKADESEKSAKEKPKAKRKAPAKKSKAKTEDAEEAAKPTRSASRRKAPTKKAADPSEAPKAKAKPRKKAAPKSKESVTKLKSSAPARRKAPSKKVSEEAPAEEKPKAKRKAPAKKAATKKAAPKKTASKAAATKKAPAKKAAPKKAAPKKTTAKKAAPKKTATKKAPARKVAPAKPKPEEPEPALKSAPMPKAEAKAAEKSEAKPKKRGWLSRLKKSID